jgi:hypothetical protein
LSCIGGTPISKSTGVLWWSIAIHRGTLDVFLIWTSGPTTAVVV